MASKKAFAQPPSPERRNNRGHILGNTRETSAVDMLQDVPQNTNGIQVHLKVLQIKRSWHKDTVWANGIVPKWY